MRDLREFDDLVEYIGYDDSTVYLIPSSATCPGIRHFDNSCLHHTHHRWDGSISNLRDDVHPELDGVDLTGTRKRIRRALENIVGNPFTPTTDDPEPNGFEEPSADQEDLLTEQRIAAAVTFHLSQAGYRPSVEMISAYINLDPDKVERFLRGGVVKIDLESGQSAVFQKRDV